MQLKEQLKEGETLEHEIMFRQNKGKTKKYPIAYGELQLMYPFFLMENYHLKNRLNFFKNKMS